MAKTKTRTKKRKTSRFRGAVSHNARKQQRGAQYGYLNLPKGVPVFKEEPGSRVNLDILPYIVTAENHPDRDDEYGVAITGDFWYRRPFWIHRNIGPENKTVVCPSSIGQKCPICEYRAQMLKDGADWNDDAVRAIKPSARNLYYVIPKGNKKYEDAPHVWDISQFLFQDKLNEELGESEEYDVFPDLEEGYTLRIRFSEESFGANKFAETSRIDFKEREDSYDESILDDLPSLDDLLEVMSFKALETIFFGGVAEDEEEKEEKPAKRKRKVAVKEEENEDDEEEEMDEDDDDEEDEEDEEEEEEKPEPKKKPKGSKKTKGKEKQTKKKPSKKGGSTCPHGYNFGEDFEEHDECDECEIWEDCMDVAES